MVLVVVDTLRADHLGIYGYERGVSPRLDERAATAVVFEQAIAPSPWTLPSMASILTGRYPARHGAGLRSDFARSTSADGFTGTHETRKMGSFSRMREDIPVLAQILSAAGYSTAATVTNHFLDPVFRTDRGFEIYDAPGDTLAGRSGDWVIDQAMEWIDELPRPFFLLVHLFDPHVPYGAPAPFAGRYTGSYDGKLELPFRKMRQVRSGRLALDDSDRQFLVDAYDEQIAFVDAELGRLMGALLDGAGADSTVVALTSDHGEEFFEHGGFEHGHTVYQELLQVPLVLWAPGLEGRRIGEPVSLVDLAPTLLDAVGLGSPEGLDGRSLWPALVRGAEPRQRPIAAQWNLYGDARSTVLEWPFKLVLGDDSAAPRLYDLASDPKEQLDISAQNPELVERLKVLARAMTDPPDAVRGEAAEVDEAMKDELEALGYLD